MDRKFELFETDKDSMEGLLNGNYEPEKIDDMLHNSIGTTQSYIDCKKRVVRMNNLKKRIQEQKKQY